MIKILPKEIQKKIPPLVWKIWEKFTKNGWEIYLVGGAVRDLLQEKAEIGDLDFTTNAHPENIQELFPEKSFYDNKYGTVKVTCQDEIVEITTYRHESGYKDFRHPQKVRWGKSLTGDLKRRDFTINAMAIGPQKTKDKSKKGGNIVLVDPHSGQEDLKNKTLRCVGNPQERFQEDALRILRAIRLATKLGFKIEEKTLAALKENAPLLKHIADERIREELFKILLDKNVNHAFELMKNTGVLDQILPELTKGYGMKQKGHHIYDVWEHSILAVKYCPSSDPVVKLAALLHDVGKPVVMKEVNDERTFYNHEVVGAAIARQIGQRLKLSRKNLDRLVRLVRWHQFSVSEKQTDKAIRRFIRRVGKENVYDMLDLRTGDRLGSGAKITSWRTEKFKKRLVEVQKQPFSVADLKINGHDVMKILKISPGPKVGQVLEEIFKKVEEGKLPNERKILLEKIEKLHSPSS